MMRGDSDHDNALIDSKIPNKVKMAEETLSRFQLLDDDQLQDMINSADSKNTKRECEILHKNIEIILVLDLGYLVQSQWEGF